MPLKYYQSTIVTLFSVSIYLFAGLPFGICKEDKMQKTGILLIAESNNIDNLKKLCQSMEKNGYFQNISFTLEVSLPFSYPDAQKDKEMIASEVKFSDAACARAIYLPIPRILFFDSFFEKDEALQKGYLLHEMAHHIIYNSDINKDLYLKVSTVQYVRLPREQAKQDIFERIANKQIKYIIELPDEILAEKWLYKSYPDLFDIRMTHYFEGDRKSINIAERDIALNKAGNLDLQKYVNRILFIKSMYSFYTGHNKKEHLQQAEMYEDCIRKISKYWGYECEFIFDYVNKIINECRKDEIDSEKIFELLNSYREDFLKEIFDYQI